MEGLSRLGASSASFENGVAKAWLDGGTIDGAAELAPPIPFPKVFG